MNKHAFQGLWATIILKCPSVEVKTIFMYIVNSLLYVLSPYSSLLLKLKKKKGSLSPLWKCAQFFYFHFIMIWNKLSYDYEVIFPMLQVIFW